MNAIGIDSGGTNIKAVLISEKGEILAQKKGSDSQGAGWRKAVKSIFYELKDLSPTPFVAGLAAPTPLAFWREKRGLTQKDLGTAAGIGQSYVAALEQGARKGDPALFKRLASALRVRMEDIVEG